MLIELLVGDDEKLERRAIVGHDFEHLLEIRDALFKTRVKLRSLGFFVHTDVFKHKSCQRLPSVAESHREPSTVVISIVVEPLASFVLEEA